MPRVIPEPLLAAICMGVVSCHAVSATMPAHCITTGRAEVWRWFLAETGADEWTIQSGTAKVMLTKTSFEAELLSEGELLHRISGSWKGDRLDALLTTESSCRVDYPLTGTCERESWEDDAYDSGRQTIMLRSGGMVVGFTRATWKNEKF